MNKYEYITKSKVNNYMVKAKHIESTSSKIYSKPTPSKEAQDIIAANQNNEPIYIYIYTYIYKTENICRRIT